MASAGEHYRWGIARLPNGRYRVRVMVRGRIIKRTLPTRQMAEAFRDQILAARAGLRAGLPPPVPTIGQALEAYRLRCSNRGLSLITLHDYDVMSVMITRHLDASTPGDLIDADIGDYIAARLAAGGGNYRINRELGHLRSALREAGITPAWTMPRLKTTSTPTHVYRDTEIARIVLSLNDHPVGRRAVLLGLLTGMRPTEVLGSDSAWVHWESNEIQVPNRKTGTVNHLPLVDTLARELRGIDGRLAPMTIPAIRGVLRRRSGRLGLNPALQGLEPMRHTAATWVLEETGDATKVDLVLSHAPPGSTRHYTKLAQAVAPKREALELVERRLHRAITAVTTGTTDPTSPPP